MSGLNRRLASISAMERAAARRIPRFAFEYLQGGIGHEACLAANRRALDAVEITPHYMLDETFEPDLSVSLFGKTWPLPFAPSPIGPSGLMWPRSAERVAAGATCHGLPIGLSSYATSSLEEIAAIAGDKLWFQLYCTIDPAIENDMIDRAEAAGCKTMIITVDIPTVTRRERDAENGLSVPPHFDLGTLRDMATRPRWCLEMLKAGIPRFRNLDRYVPGGSSPAAAAVFLSDMIDGRVTTDKLGRIRERWKGNLIVKGILTPEEALRAKQIGADAVAVSNHGGRQFDATPTSVAVLPEIREAVGPVYPLVADGGVRSALDVMRLIACGTDFVLMGRAFVYAAAAAGTDGVEHLIKLVKTELRQNMLQAGCADYRELRTRRQT
ncbi:MAG: alpha-hydroxy acid oxidase [Alphaproteobacteria bacterium]|nr:alpha-hydroxy acid oxidase [Alphaproteobacteria bacterium]